MSLSGCLSQDWPASPPNLPWGENDDMKDDFDFELFPEENHGDERNLVASTDNASDAGTTAKMAPRKSLEADESLFNNEVQSQHPEVEKRSSQLVPSAKDCIGHEERGCSSHSDDETASLSSSPPQFVSSVPENSFDLSDPATIEEHLHNQQWPLLAPGSESLHSRFIFDLHQAYEQKRESCLPASLSLISFRGIKVPVFKKPPGFSSTFCEPLQKQAAETKTFNMAIAVCIVDSLSNNTPNGHIGINFSGPTDRKLEGPFESGLFLARRGFARGKQEGVWIKPWKYEVVVEKLDKSGQWFVCVFIPLNVIQPDVSATSTETTGVVEDQGRATQALSRPPCLTSNLENCDEELSSDDGEEDALIDELVEKKFWDLKHKGCLSKPGADGEKQDQLFRKRYRTKLRKISQEYTAGKRLALEWRDLVFKEWYQRLSFEDYCGYVDKYHHLPHNRSEREVKETGILVEEDLPNLTETVENMFLYLRDVHDEIQQMKIEIQGLQRTQPEIQGLKLDVQELQRVVAKVTLAEERSPTEPATTVAAAAVAPIMTQGSPVVTRTGSMSDQHMEERVLEILKASPEPLHKLNIRRLFPNGHDGSGQTLPDVPVARVNKALYSLQRRDAVVEHGKSGSKPLWAVAGPSIL